MNVSDLLESHNGFAPILNDSNFSLPFFNKKITIDFGCSDALAICASYGITIEGVPSKLSSVVIDESQKGLGITIKFNDKKNTFIMGLGVGLLVGNIDFSKSENGVVCFSGVANQGSNNIRISLIGKDLLFFAGDGFTSVGSQVILEGKGESIILGNDCMLSWEVFFRNYDSHAIVDLTEGRIINKPGSIFIGSHVWIGQKVFIIKSCRVGHGAILGASSVVTKDVPSISAVAGNPARVIRSNVSWARESEPNVETFLDTNFIKSLLI